MLTHLIISKGTELLRFPLDKIVFISSDGNYSNLTTVDNRTSLLCMQLGQIEALIAEQLGQSGAIFIRTGRGLIINKDYIHLIDISKQRLILSDCDKCRHELTASREVLIKLKDYVDSLTPKGNGQYE